jgi:Protein of unknown function (DUF2934)
MKQQNSTNPVTEEAIRARAYQIWEEEGRPEGLHVLHWQQAVEWLANQSVATPMAAKVSTPAKAAKAKVTSKRK